MLQPLACAAGTGGNGTTTLGEIALQVQLAIEMNGSAPADRDAYIRENTLVVVGGGTTLLERALLDNARLSNAWLAGAAEAGDGPDSLAALSSGRYKLVILVGGPYQNGITREAEARGWFNSTQEADLGLTVMTGKVPGGPAIVALSDRQGFIEGSGREGAAYSPLNAIVPREYVPVAATGISILMLALINVARTVFEFKALNLGRRGKKVGEGAAFWRSVNLTEMLAIAGASTVLGISISWQFLGPDENFLFWVVVNTLICLGAAILHEVTHRIFALTFGIRMEYRFWPAGSLLTLVSSWLGNAFSIQGFILEEVEPGTPKWKVGVMKLAAVLASATVMVLFAWLYIQEPSQIYRTVYSTSALWAMAEILPFGSLDGRDIREWSHAVWFAAFVLVGGAYCAVTFFI